MSTESLIPSSDLLIKDAPSSPNDEQVATDSSNDEVASEPTQTFSVETLPSLSAESSTLKNVIEQEMKAIAASAHQEASQGLLPPEDDPSLKDDPQYVAKEGDQVFPPDEVLSQKDSNAPRVPSLGLDALGDSQTPQPVSLTPEPKNLEALAHEEALNIVNDESQANLSVMPLPPADLDLIAHSPPTKVSLPKNQSLNDLNEPLDEVIEDKLVQSLSYLKVYLTKEDYLRKVVGN